MDFLVVTEIGECERLWEKFSPQHTLWDLWGVAISFYDEKHFKPHFIKIMDNGEEVGLLPLWENFEKKQYNFFAGTYLENKSFWFDTSIFPKIFEHIPENTVLYDMNGVSASKIVKEFEEYSKHFINEDFRYHLDLKTVNHEVEEYLSRFNKKHRKNFLNDIKKVMELKPELVWESNEHFDYLVRFNLERFGSESDFFNDEYFTTAVKKMMEFFHSQNMLKTLIVKINGKIEGIEMAVYYDEVYYVINGGYNAEIKNLGKLIMYEHIKKSMQLKAREIDFLVGDTGWKQLWNLEKESYFTFKKEID